MTTQWHSLKAWLAAHEPDLLADLGPPAGESAIKALELRVGVALPPDFEASLRAHDGQHGRAAWLFDGYQYLSIENILMSWEAWHELSVGGDFDGRVARPDSAIRNVWWHDGWVPFASNGGGDYMCLDLAPEPMGTVGQVIRVFHDMPQRVLVAPSFSAWFDSFVGRKTDH